MSDAEDKAKGHSETDISKVAASWLVALDKGLTPSQQDAFLDWLSADPRHRAWLERHKETWACSEVLTQWRPKHSKKPNPDLLEPRFRSRQQVVKLLSIGLAACIAIAFFLTTFTSDSSHEDYFLAASDSPGAYQTHFLSDGSLVELNAGSQIKVIYTPKQRTIHLLRGEAHFSVSENPNRPFVVEAGETEVVAVGTAFNVRYDNEAIEVIVTEGRVRFDRTTLQTDAELEKSSPTVAELKKELSAGERSVIYHADIDAPPIVQVVSQQEVEQLLSWKIEQFQFDRTPLRDAVKRFNARNKVQMRIADPSLNPLSISATFKSDNPRGFAELLSMIADISAEESAKGVILLSKASGRGD